jgi:hypothetical protein
MHKALALLPLLLCSCEDRQLQTWRLLEAPLLQHWQSAGIEGEGSISLAGSEIVLGPGQPMTGVKFTAWSNMNLPLVDYAIEFEATRVDGQDIFAGITFPIRRLDTCATLVVGGWGGGLVGISSIDGLNANENSTRGEHPFTNGQWYRFRLEVRDEELKAWLEDRLVINASIKSRTISLRPGQIEQCVPFGVATYLSTGKVRGLVVTELGGAHHSN